MLKDKPEVAWDPRFSRKTTCGVEIVGRLLGAASFLKDLQVGRGRRRSKGRARARERGQRKERGADDRGKVVFGMSCESPSTDTTWKLPFWQGWEN